MHLKQNILRVMLLLLSFCFIFYGCMRGEAQVVLGKAVVVCLQCIGLG